MQTSHPPPGLKKCKLCKAWIGATASRCQHCQSNQMPLSGAGGFLIAALVILIILVLKANARMTPYPSLFTNHTIRKNLWLQFPAGLLIV